MKILHLCNYFQPILGYQEFFLAREHVKQGHEVTVLTSDRYFPFPDYYNTVYKILGNRIIGKSIENIQNFKVIRLGVLFEFSARVWLIGLKSKIKKIKPDIIICHGIMNFNSLRVINLKSKLDFKLIFDDHMHYSEENKGILGKFIYSVFNFKKIERNAYKIIGVSSETVDFIIKKYRISENRVELIPLGADSDFFKLNPKLRKNFRKKYKISDNEIIITYTGKLTFKKGPHNIFLAIKKIFNNINNKIILLFVGDFEKDYERVFENARKDINNIIRILQLPLVENKKLVEIYSASDICCWPRQASMSMIEAMSCSVPIICCDFLTERIKNNNGIPIKEDNIEDLARALLKLINDSKLRKEMGKRSRELVENELSWSIVSKKFIM